MNAPIALFLAPPGSQPKRHPWFCEARLSAGRRCCTFNRASDGECRRCGAPYTQERREGYHSTNLAHAPTVTAICEGYRAAEEAIRSSWSLMESIETELGILLASYDTWNGPKIGVRPGRGNLVEWNRPEEVLRELQATMWGRIVEVLGLSTCLSAKDLAKMEATIEDMRRPVEHRRNEFPEWAFPPLEEAAVMRWFETIAARLPHLLEGKILEVFDFMRPPRSALKTNQRPEVARRVVLEYAVTKADPRWAWRPSVEYSRHQHLAMLEQVCRAFDGKGMRSDPTPEIVRAVAKVNPDDPTFETTYFRGKACRNGNLHLEWKREDLRMQVNRVGGGKVLA